MAQRVILIQADGHSSVAFRPSIGSKSTAMIPNGTTVSLVGREGEYLKVVSHQGQVGYVKARNGKLLVPKPMAKVAAPKPMAKVAAPKPMVAAPVAPAPAQVPAPAAPAPTGTECTFDVNGKTYLIDLAKTDMDRLTSVHDWIAANVSEAGIRRSCGVGRCGSCLCTLTFKNKDNKTEHVSFNSCLRPILSCNGMSITTSAGIGTMESPHPIQKALAAHSGTQCGFCSAGMVMNLYARLLAAKTQPTEAELDKMVDSNYCRCTGYRPILDTYKSFANPATVKPVDEADLSRRADVFNAVTLEKPERNHDKEIGAPKPHEKKATEARVASTDGPISWTEVTTEQELQQALLSMSKMATPPSDIFLVGGHTSRGIDLERRPNAMIDIGKIATLKTLAKTQTGIEIGAGATLQDTIDFLAGTGLDMFKKMAEHGTLSPGSNIRHTGTIGGNFMVFYEHQFKEAFPTEWPMLFGAAGATVHLTDGLTGNVQQLTVFNFFAVSRETMKYMYITKVTVPLAGEGARFLTFRTAARARYAETIAAAAMNVTVKSGVVDKATLVFNGVTKGPATFPALNTAMHGMPIARTDAMQSILSQMETTLSGAGARSNVVALCQGYFYKLMLNLQPSLPPSLASAATPWIEKETTQGTQVFQPEQSVAPLSLPIPKIDGLEQCTGQATYVQNLPLRSNTLHAAVVLATKVGNFTVSDANVTVRGYKQLVLAKDTPGKQVFADKQTEYIGECVALALADTPDGAVQAARQVEVSYSNIQKPIVTIEDAIAKNSFHDGESKFQFGDADKAIGESEVVVTDAWDMGTQYHFHMETQSALALPTGKSKLVVHSSTQLPVVVRDMVALTAKLSKSAVVVENQRCGGGFGGKLMNSVVPAQMAAVAALTTGQAVSIIFEQTDNMKMLGMRVPWRITTTIGCSKDGTINGVKLRPFANGGAAAGSKTGSFMNSFDNCYNIKNWDILAKTVKTNLPGFTSMRAPGWLPAIFSAERMISVVAAKLNMDPAAVRAKNLYQTGDVTPLGMHLTDWDIDTLMQRTKEATQYTQRLEAVKEFNKANRWVKKGMSLVPSKFGVGYDAGAEVAMDVQLTVEEDGSVNIMCGGTEMGQGLTTKVVQTVAYALKIDMGLIHIMDQSTTVLGKYGAADVTGGSVGSELTCWAARNACVECEKALAPVRTKLPITATWQEVVAEAYKEGVRLSFHAMDAGVPGPVDKAGHNYNTYGCAALEVTYDVLTGQIDFNRADVMYDLGRSVNPIVDIGQLEGGFIMGLGYTMVEDLRHSDTGSMNNADYLIPTPWEIPTTFNVTLAKEIPNKVTAGGGKACGEPPVTCTYAAIEAVEMAINAARSSAGAAATLTSACPVPVEARHSLGAASYKDFSLK